MCITMILFAAKELFAVKFAAEGAMCQITPFSWKKSANSFYIYQNDYNNTVLGDKMYHWTDSALFFVLKKVLFVK